MMSSANVQLNDAADSQKAARVLFVGPSLAATKNVFSASDSPVFCEQVDSTSLAVEEMQSKLASQPYTSVMVDMRATENENPLHVVKLAASKGNCYLTVLCQPQHSEVLQSLPGVDKVLVAPVAPKEVVDAILASSTREMGIGENKPKIDGDGVVNTAEGVTSEGTQRITPGFETSLSALHDRDNQLWQRFVPFASFLYKKLAIVVLSALFLTFLAYGSMIVFFMSSSSWSLPFELSKGHVLVEKVERDLSSMRVRLNQLSQELITADKDLANAIRDRRDGLLQIQLIRRTIEEELHLQRSAKLEIQKHIERLKEVIRDFNRLNGRGKFATNLEGAYAKRLITKKSLNSGTLAVLETLHRMALVQNEVSLKQLELDKVSRRVEFLTSLLAEIGQPEIRVVTSAGSDIAHLAKDAIVAKNTIAAAEKSKRAATKRQQKLNNSVNVLSQNIAYLESTPAARALDEPVNVLFVPYTNSENLQSGTPLYGCSLFFFWCSQVGEVGSPVDGETTAVHPLFGKPLRGTFVEAKLKKSKSVTQELLHASRAPLLF